MTALKIIAPAVKEIFSADGRIISAHALHEGMPAQAQSHYVRRPDNDNKLPFLVVTPHAGIWTPKSLEGQLADDMTLLEVIQRGDVFTDILTTNAPLVGATQIISLVAPSYLNVGRNTTSINPNDVRGGLVNLKHNPNDKYVGQGEGQGLVAVKSLYGNKNIYADGHVPNESEIKYRIQNFYTPFHRKLETAVNQNIDAHGYSLLFDIHSCPSIGAPKDPDAGEERDDIIFSNNVGLSCSPKLMEMVVDLAKKFDYSVSENHPYKGGFNTQKFARKTDEGYEEHDFGQRGSESLQIEYNRKSMGLNESALIITDIEKFCKMQAFTNTLMERMAGYTRLQMAP